MTSPNDHIVAARVADVIVREAIDGDSDNIIELIDAVYEEYPGCVLKVDDEEPELREPASAYDRIGGRFWVAVCDDIICGTVAIAPTDAPHVARLNKLYVRPAARSRGIGEAMCNLVERTARDDLHAEMLMLYSDSRFTNSHRLYERLGYEQQPGLVHRNDASNSVEHVYTKKL